MAAGLHTYESLIYVEIQVGAHCRSAIVDAALTVDCN